MNVNDLGDMDFKMREVADPRVLDQLGKLGSGIALLYKAITKPFPMPKVFQVRGEVRLTEPVRITNLADLEQYFTKLESQISRMVAAVSMIPQQKIELPRIEFPKIEVPGMDPKLTKAITGIERHFTKGQNNEDMIDALFQIRQGIQALVERPQMTPAPVTHVSVNSLSGVMQATTVTVGTSATLLPNAALPNRRSMLVYNASANTIYLGGSTVAVAGTGQGLPVLTLSYAPSLDAGINLPVYAIAAAPSTVNVLEISDEASGK